MKEAKVIKVRGIQTPLHHGALAVYDIDGYITQDCFIGDGTMLDTRVDKRLARSGIPLEYVYKSANSFDWSKYGEDMITQKRIINAFVMEFNSFKREGRGLYICSETRGSGKTFLACCAAKEILKRHDITVKFINTPDYIELIKEKDDGSREKRNSIVDATLLILDDIGAQVENKEWITTALFRLIDRRYTNHLPTIFTSNVYMENLKTDERIADRIYSVSVPVPMPEVSVRRNLADKHTKEFLDRVMGKS